MSICNVFVIALLTKPGNRIRALCDLLSNRGVKSIVTGNPVYSVFEQNPPIERLAVENGRTVRIVAVPMLLHCTDKKLDPGGWQFRRILGDTREVAYWDEAANAGIAN